jgi:phage-related tail fiber protein
MQSYVENFDEDVMKEAIESAIITLTHAQAIEYAAKQYAGKKIAEFAQNRKNLGNEGFSGGDPIERDEVMYETLKDYLPQN